MKKDLAVLQILDISNVYLKSQHYLDEEKLVIGGIFMMKIDITKYILQ